MFVIASDAKQSRSLVAHTLDCLVIRRSYSFLAMTGELE